MILVSDTSVVLLPLPMQFCMYVWVCKNLGQLKSWNIQNTGSCHTCKTDKMIWFQVFILIKVPKNCFYSIRPSRLCVINASCWSNPPTKKFGSTKTGILLYSQNILLDFIKILGIHHQVILCQIKKSSQLLSMSKHYKIIML